jgi:hypothetical protein
VAGLAIAAAAPCSGSGVADLEMVGVGFTLPPSPVTDPFYEIDKNSAAYVEISDLGTHYANAMAVDSVGRVYASVEEDSIIRIHPLTGAKTPVCTLSIGTSEYIGALAFDGSDHLYGMLVRSVVPITSTLVLIDLGQGSHKAIGTSQVGIAGMDFRKSDGTLFAIGPGPDDMNKNDYSFYTINPGSGAASLVGSYVAPGEIDTTIAFDEYETLFAAHYDLCTLNPATGAISTWQGNIGRNIRGADFTVRGPGDFDRNGWVAFGDFSLFSVAYGLSPGDPGWHPRFDMDYNGTTGFGDFSLFSGLYGTSYDYGWPLTSPVPEPAALSLVAVGISAVFARRRR